MRSHSLNPREESLLRPLHETRLAFYVVLAAFATIFGLGLFAYIVQLQEGLVVTGMRDRVAWGLYVSNFVFFIGISHAGTLISAILRVTHAEWRYPITRMAEAITAFALVVAATMVIVDMGRPERILNVVFFGRLESAILWDFLSITTYLSGSVVYLYLPMIPDLAICRDNIPASHRWKKKLYTLFSLNWKGTQGQKQRLEKGISIMAVLIIPVAVSVHTVVSWIFAMTSRAGWHSAIFGPYFVVGAIFSGVAVLIVVMVIFRRAFHLEEYLRPRHFSNLGLILLTMNIALIYFTLNEYLTMAYAGEVRDRLLLSALFSGEYAILYWTMVTFLVVSAFLLAHPRTRTIRGVLISAILVSMAMWIERLLIVVPSMSVPLVSYIWGRYSPTWVEWSITAGAFAGFAILFMAFAKMFPIVSIWETRTVEKEAASVGTPSGSPSSVEVME